MRFSPLPIQIVPSIPAVIVCSQGLSPPQLTISTLLAGTNAHQADLSKCQRQGCFAATCNPITRVDVDLGRLRQAKRKRPRDLAA